MIIKKQKGKIVIEPELFISRTKEDVLANAGLVFSVVGGNAKVNAGLISVLYGNAGVNAGLIYSGIKGNAGVNAGLFSVVEGDAGANIGGLFSVVEGDAGANIGGLFSGVKGNAGVNAGLFSVVEGNAGANIGGLFSGVEGNAGVNAGLIYSVVEGNAGVNAGLLYSKVGESHDYTIGDIAPRITKYLPNFLKQIALPAINFGAVTNTKKPYNSFIAGIFNKIIDTGGDYLALGLVNRITSENGKTRYVPLLSGRFHFDGIFRHRNNKSLDAKVENKK